MTTIPTIVVTPSAAANAYGRVDRGEVGNSVGAGDFGAMVQQSLQGAADTLHAADAKSVEALSGGGNLTDVRHRGGACRAYAADGDRGP